MHCSYHFGLQVLQSLGIEFPEQPTKADIGQAFGVTRSHWADKAPSSLLDLPTMRDAQLLAAMEILTALVPAAYVAAPNLMPLLIFKQVGSPGYSVISEAYITPGMSFNTCAGDFCILRYNFHHKPRRAYMTIEIN
jgi:predicted ATPase